MFGNRTKEEIAIFVFGISALILGLKTMHFVLLGLGVLIVSLFILVGKAREDPGAPWVRFLWGLRGPNTNVASMLKSELYSSGLQFLGISSVFGAVSVAIILFFEQVKDLTYNPLALGIFFGSFILFASFFCGGLYMLLRGLLKKEGSDK